MCRCRPAVYVGGGPSYRSMMLKERAKLLDREQLAPSSMKGKRKARRSSASSRIWRGNATLHTRYSRLGLFCWNHRAQRERLALTCSKHTHTHTHTVYNRCTLLQIPVTPDAACTLSAVTHNTKCE